MVHYSRSSGEELSQPVAGTNNEAERTLRNPAQARDTGRTNKSTAGARRQTIIVSVLESLRVYLKTFTLRSIMAEIERWCQSGQSCFRKLSDCSSLILKFGKRSETATPGSIKRAKPASIC